MTSPVVLKLEHSVAIITLNRPELHNPISDADMVDALVGALHAVNADESVSVAILTGAGESFSSGGNLKTIGQPGQLGGGTPATARLSYTTGIQAIPRTFETLEIPIIAAVNGNAIGAGCDLACMCDIRIAARSARFAESFVKLGLIPGDGGAWLLPRIVGFSKASEMTFTGAAIDAEEALRCGLVSSVVEDGELMSAALGLAQRIAANPGPALRMAKRLMMQGRGVRLSEHLDLAAASQAVAHSTDEYHEAVAAFKEKRSPRFAKRKP